MAFDPLRFLNVADFVLASSSYQSEEYLRTGVGRAYYAAHVSARDYLDSRVKLQRDKAGKPTHQGVVDALKRGTLPYVGDALDQLMDKRHVSDYEMGSQVTLADLTEARILAETVLRNLSSCY
jgi:hypothetical protein